jgi:Tfp pilus assembly protein PilE
MRAFGLLATLIVAAIGVYLYSVQLRGTSATTGQTNPTEVADVMGVKTALVGIANAERQYYASQARYASFDELTEGHYISMAKTRNHYTYDIETTSTGFQVTATRDGAGSPAQLSIDETMQVQTSN